MRSKVNSRIIGITIIAVSLIFFFLPISVLEFIPKFFFGAILTFIAFDLMEEWLVRVSQITSCALIFLQIHSYRLLRPIDYAVVWATFFAILGLNLEYGMLVVCGCKLPVMRSYPWYLGHRNCHLSVSLSIFTGQSCSQEQESQQRHSRVSAQTGVGSN